MRLLFLCVSLVKAALAEGLTSVSEYVGESVTLPSGADPSWDLSEITWSVFPNTTWIATHLDGKSNVNRFHRYKDRLDLSVSTGDLTIHKLMQDDAMEYTVDLLNAEGKNNVNKIKLIVKQHLRKPKIHTLSSNREECCLMGLHCISPDDDVSLSWKTDPQVETFSENRKNGSYLLVFLNSTQTPVEFTCISSKNMDNITSAVSLKCEDQPPPKSTPHPALTPSPDYPFCRDRSPLFILLGFVLGIIAALIVHCYKQRERTYIVTKSQDA